jgi:hypothetical protein
MMILKFWRRQFDTWRLLARPELVIMPSDMARLLAEVAHAAN